MRSWSMKIFAVILKGQTEIEFFEADSFTVDKGAATLMRLSNAPIGPVAMFPFENLIGIIDLTANASVSKDQLNERLKEGKNPLINLGFLKDHAKKHPGDETGVAFTG